MRAQFELAFREFGLPDRMRSDNGAIGRKHIDPADRPEMQAVVEAEPRGKRVKHLGIDDSRRQILLRLRLRYSIAGWTRDPRHCMRGRRIVG